MRLPPDAARGAAAYGALNRIHTERVQRRGTRAMTRYERKLFFERLMTLRETYRTEAHVATDLTIEGVVAFAAKAYDDAAVAEAAVTTVKGARTAD